MKRIVAKCSILAVLACLAFGPVTVVAGGGNCASSEEACRACCDEKIATGHCNNYCHYETDYCALPMCWGEMD